VKFRVLLPLALVLSANTLADENLFGKVKGAETLPEGSWEAYQFVTERNNKGTGRYRAIDSLTEIEYGVSNRFTASAALTAMTLDTQGLIIDGYLPEERNLGFTFTGVELSAKYNFLSPALDDVGLSGYWALDYMVVDPHSGQDKDTYSLESTLIAQKYFLEGELVWAGNLGFEATSAKRKPIDNLPDDFEWPTEPEMEIELLAGTGLTYRFAANWFIGAEALYETEYETEVGQERWSIFAGPSLHYGSQQWWATLTWLEQVDGGGELVQDDDKLHLIEKTKREVRLKLGYNF
jgi:hypothetical protein